ncbi:nicotianamine synthase family protein [Halalkalibacter lacteus]|uniref:nicotianamine synthase family protein n=1 Tax=Halalkalibacter lacteus TaxID=3090663 RepID=UPI002FCAF42E
MDEKEKYIFIICLKLLEFEIKELGVLSKKRSTCYDLLRQKIDTLSSFVVSESNRMLWEKWGGDPEVKKQTNNLREMIVQAICDLEKYESKQIIDQDINTGSYFKSLSEQVEVETKTYDINENSYVLFIGAGALPISALAIANKANAQMVCIDIDIDEEVIPLAERVTTSFRLDSLVSFSNLKASSLPTIHKVTHVIVASLVKDKDGVISDLYGVLKPESKIIVRYGNGLKSIFNYPLEKNNSLLWNWRKRERKKQFYDTALVKWFSTNNVGVN